MLKINNNNYYYNEGYQKGLNREYNADVTYKFHVHSVTSTTQTETAISFSGYTDYPASDEYILDSPSGCYTKKYYTATQTVQKYHAAVAGGPIYCNRVLSVGSSNGYGCHDTVCPVHGSQGLCDDNNGELDMVRAGHSRCGVVTGYNPSTPAYWSNESVTTVEGWGDCPNNTNNGSTAVVYSDIVYRYYPDCGYSDKQVLDINIHISD